MTERLCPDWRTLVEDRDRSADGEARWRLGLEHAAQCSACRRHVVALEPLAVFTLSAVARGADPSANEPEIAAMLEAVSTIRRHRGGARVPRSRWLSWAAVAALALSLSLLAAPAGRENEMDRGLEWAGDGVDALAGALEESGSEPATLGPVTVGSALVDLGSADSLESSESVAARTPRVYRWHDQDLSVVMIVDETLDV